MNSTSMTRRSDQLFARSRAGRFGLVVVAGLYLALGAPLLPAADPKPATAPATTHNATRPPTTTTATPATSPATKPAATAATATAAAPLSPKAVAIAFAGMVEKGDADAAKALLPDQPERVQWLKATIELVGALQKLDAAAVDRFGEGGKAVSQNQLHVIQSFKSLEQAQEKVEGDSATLTTPGQRQPLQLKKVAGRWQLQLGPAPADVPAQVELYHRLAEAAHRTAQEVADGAYQTPDAAAKVFAGRILSARAG